MLRSPGFRGGAYKLAKGVTIPYWGQRPPEAQQVIHAWRCILSSQKHFSQGISHVGSASKKFWFHLFLALLHFNVKFGEKHSWTCCNCPVWYYILPLELILYPITITARGLELCHCYVIWYSYSNLWEREHLENGDSRCKLPMVGGRGVIQLDPLHPPILCLGCFLANIDVNYSISMNTLKT